MAATVSFVVLAALGTWVRAEASRLGNLPDQLPAGTLAVNLVGSLALGALAGTGTTAMLAVAAGTGLLGALTSLSAFGREVGAMVLGGAWARATAYTVVTFVGGVAAAWFGLSLTDCGC
ncbi:MAG: CrcB family protein [Acidimicrobiia bacterium]|nr:CrcB family protein [Acidimicrobiia bacterium]